MSIRLIVRQFPLDPNGIAHGGETIVDILTGVSLETVRLAVHSHGNTIAIAVFAIDPWWWPTDPGHKGSEVVFIDQISCTTFAVSHVHFEVEGSADHILSVIESRIRI